MDVDQSEEPAKSNHVTEDRPAKLQRRWSIACNRPRSRPHSVLVSCHSLIRWRLDKLVGMGAGGQGRNLLDQFFHLFQNLSVHPHSSFFSPRQASFRLQKPVEVPPGVSKHPLWHRHLGGPVPPHIPHSGHRKNIWQ